MTFPENPWRGSIAQMDGTESWVYVVTVENPKLDYEWDILAAFWERDTDRYFWLADSGCSCDYWGEFSKDSKGTFESGSKDDLLRAIDTWDKFYSWDGTRMRYSGPVLSPEELSNAKSKVIGFHQGRKKL